MAAQMTPAELRRYAEMGVQTRIRELQSELQELQRIFPNVAATGRPTPERTAPTRRRRHMSAKSRAEVSARMKKYWAEKRKEKAATAAAKGKKKTATNA